MDISTISVQCPKCGHSMEYWTRRDFINCVECGNRIEVEPCEEIVEEIKEGE